MPKMMNALRYACFCMAVATSTVPAHAQGSRQVAAASYLDRGNSWFTKGELERALADFTLALEFHPKYAAAHHNRAAVRLRKGDLEGALADFCRAINLDSRLVEAYMGRSEIRYRKGDLDGVTYRSAKLISIFSATSTGSPLRVPGLNFHFLSASTAFSSRPNPRPRSTFKISIEPSLRTMADRTTLP
jgi:tetratricopeptide (TPR) repeat protein